VACKACKYKHGYHNGGHDHFWLNCNVGCKKPNAEHALIAPRFSQALSQKIFYEQMVAFIQSKGLELHLKQTFKTCHFNESRLS